jgi:hypothetical protein
MKRLDALLDEEEAKVTSTSRFSDGYKWRVFVVIYCVVLLPSGKCGAGGS